MKMKIGLPPAALESWKKDLEDKLEIAAVKAWEAAVERTPAAGEGPYSTGYLRQSIRFQKTGKMEYTLTSPVQHSAFLEFGTGPRGQASGQWADFPDDPYNDISYHDGEVLVTRRNGQILNEPYIRHTGGMKAQPFMRPALLVGFETLKKLLNR